MTCYETLSGRRPFEELKLSEVVEKVRAGLRPSLPNSLPTSLSSLIECCWDGDVRRRPSFARISTELRHLKGIYLISDCGGANQTFATLPFRMAPEDVESEIETDDTVRDTDTFWSTMHDLRRQVQEQTEMLREKDETLRDRDQTIQMLLARERRFKGRSCVVQ